MTVMLCSGAERGQAQPRAESGLGEGAEKVMSVHIALGEEELFFLLCRHVQQSVVL